MRSVCYLVLLIASACAFGGCGSEAFVPPELTYLGGGGDDGYLVVGPTGDPVPEGFARMTFGFRWPDRPADISARRLVPVGPDAFLRPDRSADVSARRIIAVCAEIAIEVTGNDMSPVTATITPPATSVTFDVPAGANRAISFEMKDASSVHIATNRYSIASLVGGKTYSYKYTLFDDYEPNNTWDKATVVPVDDIPRWSWLQNGVSGVDNADWFTFDVTAAPVTYSFLIENIKYTVTWVSLYLQPDLLSTNHSTVLKDGGDVSAAQWFWAYQFTSNGTYYFTVQAGVESYGGGESLEYQFRIREEQGSTSLKLTAE